MYKKNKDEKLTTDKKQNNLFEGALSSPKDVNKK